MRCINSPAINLATSTVIGQTLGGGDLEQATYYAKKLLKITYIATAVLNTFIFANLFWILRVYDLSDDARRLALVLILIHNGFAMLMWPAAFTLPNCLRAGGDVKFTMIVSVTSMIVFRIVFSVILGIRCGMGAVGVWIAMIMDWVCRTVCFVLRFRKGVWKTIQVI